MLFLRIITMIPIKKKDKNKDPERARYAARSQEYGTAEQRLGDALVSGGRDVGDLTTLLGAMNSPTYVRPLTSSFSFGGEDPDDSGYYMRRSRPSGRAYLSGNGMPMYQPASEEEGMYEGAGRAITSGDVLGIMGSNASVPNSQLSKVSKLLRDPAVLQYFMDIYGEAGQARRPDTVTLKNKKQDVRVGGKNDCNTLHIVDGVPMRKRDPSCKNKD